MGNGSTTNVAKSLGNRVKAGGFLAAVMGGVAAVIGGASGGVPAAVSAAVGTGLSAFILGLLLGPYLPNVPGGKDSG